MSADPLSLIRLRQIQPIETEELANEFISDGVINSSKLVEAIQLLLSYIDTEGSIMEAINRAKSELPINFLKFNTEIVDTSIVNILNFDHTKVVGKLPFNTLKLGFIVSRNGAIQEEGKDFTADYENDQLTFISNDLDANETITLRCLYYDEPVISNYITFADPEVERICIENWSSDGIGLTYEDAAAVTTLGTAFSYWVDNPPIKQITSFNELQYFTSLTILEYDEINDSGTFSGAEELTSIILSSSLKTIGKNCFCNCMKLTSITIPNSVTSIGDYAFKVCSGLTSITIPNSITSIETGVFESCSGLTSITIGNSVTSIGSQAFAYCSGLTSITILNSVTLIDFAAFDNCTGLISITIGNSVTSIGSYAFNNCNKLTSVIVESLTPPIAGSDMFSNNVNLTNIYVPAESVDAYKTAEGWSGYAEFITAIAE